jgi:hypothetical protein
MLFRAGEKLGQGVIEVRTIGHLYVPSGRIIACDPLVPMDTTPFTTLVPSGTHPIEISIARFPNDDERIAAARLRWSNDTADSWLMALREGQNPAALEPNSFFGYGVDAGVGCFMDAETFAPYDQRQADSEHNYYDDVLAKELDVNYKHTRTWTIHHPIGGDPRNVAVFHSGWGDGTYGSYFGFRDGTPLCLVTDFMVVPES